MKAALGLQTLAKRPVSSPSIQHIPELDGVRGIAVLLVLFFHAFAWPMENQSWSGIAEAVRLVTLPGWVGVDLFFVLSGFLITGTLLDAKDSPHYYRNFYVRRALRILPAYYALLLLILLFYPHSEPFTLLSFLHLSNLVSLFGVTTLYGPLWSLSVEEHFYAVWPWIVSATNKKGLAAVCVSLFLAEPVLRLIGFYRHADLYQLTWFRLDGLVLGAMLCLLVRSLDCLPNRLLSIAAGAVALALAMIPFGVSSRRNAIGAALQFTCLSLLFFGLLAWLLAMRGTRSTAVFRSRFLTYCGTISYTIYLFHWFSFDLWERFHPRNPNDFRGIVARAAFGVGLTFVVASLSFRYFESPIGSLKRYFPNNEHGEEHTPCRSPCSPAIGPGHQPSTSTIAEPLPSKHRSHLRRFFPGTKD